MIIHDNRKYTIDMSKPLKKNKNNSYLHKFITQNEGYNIVTLVPLAIVEPSAGLCG